MNIIGCDLHTRYQVVAWVDEETGKIRTRRLEHGKEEVQAFYVGWPRGAQIGIEATFPALWFERLLAECGHELWVGDAAQIRAKAERDLRQLLVHRMKLVRVRTLVKNQLHALAMSQGVCRKRKRWSVRGRAELQSLVLLPWASRRRHELLAWLEQLEAAIAPLDRAVEQEAQARPEAVLLMTHPGVGPVVSLTFVLTVG